LFGLVLAIGLVVDDAIVVVGAVEHHIEQGPAGRLDQHRTGFGPGIHHALQPYSGALRLTAALLPVTVPPRP